MTAHRPFDLSGRTVLVTGASSGLGERFARILADGGARVALAARRVDRLEALRDALIAQGGQAMVVEMDVASEASTIAAYDAIEAELGPVDSVIANAGMNSEGMLLDISVDEFDRVMAVNLRGAFVTAREGAKRMITAGSQERRHGRIVIISSITANTVTGGIGTYSASKAGILHLGKHMALEWARKGVNVNMVMPGYIATELNGDWFATEGGKKQINKWPRRRLMQSDDLDAILLYLASDASGAVTGSAFTIDDGQSL
ncbi:MAG: SDR family NAD(P)-dependent oxidoreductase [Sphingobium sp.]